MNGAKMERKWIPTHEVQVGDWLAHKLSDTPWTYTPVTGWADRELQLSRYGLADVTHRVFTVQNAPWWVDAMDRTHDLNGKALIIRAPHIHRGVVFDTHAEANCEAVTSPDESGTFRATGSRGVERSYNVLMVATVYPCHDSEHG
jgi:hypothetical protein